jgi:stage V sporulation protein G
MEITEVKVFPVQEEKLKAFASIVIDRCFMVNDIKVIQGKDGLFISMPSRRKKNGDFKDVAHPLNNETRRMMEERILAEYARAREARPGEAQPGMAAPAVRRSEPRPLAPSPPPAAPPSEGEEEGKSVDEVAEAHLRDSFWTV